MSYGSPNPGFGPPQDPQQPYGYPQQGQPGYGYPQAPGLPPQDGGYGGYGYPQAPGFPGGPAPRVASMGRRFGARLIDAVVFGVIYGILIAVGVAGMVGEAEKCDPSSIGYETCMDNAGSGIASGLAAAIGVMAVIGLIYEWLMTGLFGATLGKLAVGIRVVKVENGQKPGLGKSFLRWIIPIVGSFACGIGQLVVYLSPFWDKSGRQQGWHDKAASTMVIQN
ncbi:RDD family protein [Streptomyces eurythermus]|uniref:RDD family protein n=1 Tax=Streptomyces eurythermus TaxID=42237 RepID=UPI00370152C0